MLHEVKAVEEDLSVRALAELEFVAKAENIVLIGEPARGKTGLAYGLLTEGPGEWLPRSVRQRPRSLRWHVGKWVRQIFCQRSRLLEGEGHFPIRGV